MKLTLFITVLFCAVFQSTWAQGSKDEGRFTAAIVAGISLSQIDGDNDASYSKVGFNGGARGGVRFGDKMELCTEILFSQKGSAISTTGEVFHLDYIEVPVLFYYKDWAAMTPKNRKYMRVMIGAGLSYSRLVNSGVFRNNVWVDPSNTPGWVDPFAKNDLMFMFDANFFFTRNWGLNIRWSRSILNIIGEGNSLRDVNNPTVDPLPAFTHAIAIRAIYRI